MGRKLLATNLLAQKTEKERRKLLAQNARLADAKLAVVIKNICYDAWTSEPVVAQRAARALASLSAGNPAPHIKAYALWISGIANITRGRLTAAVEDLAASSYEFGSIGREHDSAQPRVAQLMALGMLARYDEATTVGENALEIFVKHGDTLAAGKIEMNLSNVLSRRELHRDAIRYGLSAAKRFSSLGADRWLAMAQNDVAREYAQVNDFVQARRYFEQALSTARGAGMIVTEAEIEASMSNLAVFRGQYAEALALTECSRRKYQNLGMPHESAVAEMEAADIYSEINLAAEACEIYESVVRSFSRLKMRREEAAARANLGRSSAAIGNIRRARRELAKANKLFKDLGNAAAGAFVRLDEALLECRTGDRKLALQLIGEAKESLVHAGHERGLLAADLLEAEALTGVGRTKAAESILLRLVERARRFEHVTIVEASLDLLGKIALSRGDVKSAAAYFRKAVAMIESSRTAFGGEEFRRAFFEKRLESFENLVRIYLSRGRVRDALKYVERSRSRSLLDALGEGDAKELSDEGAMARRELNWLYKRLTEAGEDDSGLHARISRSERSLADLTRRAESLRVNRVADARGDTDSLAHIQDRLGPGRAIVEYISLDGIVGVFVLTKDAIKYVPLVSDAEVASALEGLQFQFSGMRYGKLAGEAVRAQIRSRTNGYLRQLYDLLIRPIEERIGQRDLIVVPAGLLHYVPFQALHDGHEYLIESREIQYAPSSSVWYRLDGAQPQKKMDALLIGFADDAIPLVEDEISALGRTLKNSRSLTGAAATFSAYIDQAPQYEILHIACHGEFKAASPMFSSLHLSDGWVTVGDICRQRLKARLVTLSACETGLSAVHPGEELLGLTRGFLTAGARALVVSLWRVDDTATMDLMVAFYENLQRGYTIGASLRKAQIGQIGKSVSPYYWSPFVFIGA